MSSVSVITITRNRDCHLQKLIYGLRHSSVAPLELIVVDMGDRPICLPDLPFQACRLPLANKGLPLAAARNLGARKARGEHLLFLDVDCIPRRNLTALMDEALRRQDALICAEVRYLGPVERHLKLEEEMLDVAVPHPVRDFPQSGLQAESNPGLFWSLTFGIRRNSFARLDGFDESFVGYGAEDTDFGLRAVNAAIPLFFLGGTGSFHQHHEVYSPPMQHFEDIVRNANRFYAKWGYWPMEGWLAEFEAMGLIRGGSTELTIIRRPTRIELDVARRSSTNRF
jgi:GT2 family glycosyltransferase